MKLKALLPLVPLSLASALAAGIWTPNQALYLRTNDLNVGGDDFTGSIPSNDLSVISQGIAAVAAGGVGGVLTDAGIDVDREPGAGVIDLSGDNHDIAVTFQFFDADGAFSFTENYDDRVQVNITPIVSNLDLTARGDAGATHQNTGWNARTEARYNFGEGGWFAAEVIFTEDGGGAQSAADIGFGFSSDENAQGPGSFGGIGYVPGFGQNAGEAVFDADGNGNTWGSLLVPEPSSLLLSLGGLFVLFRRRR
ncbi:MAG: PEP-CTERM sorting domain-containing protein [Roseibacillus sp.]|nr:PEP-CTERM sorting domain-containing protein [Roseibacillus sp.]